MACSWHLGHPPDAPGMALGLPRTVPSSLIHAITEVSAQAALCSRLHTHAAIHTLYVSMGWMKKASANPATVPAMKGGRLELSASPAITVASIWFTDVQHWWFEAVASSAARATG